MKWAVFGFSQTLILVLQSHLEALKSIGLILLSKMIRGRFLLIRASYQKMFKSL